LGSASSWGGGGTKGRRGGKKKGEKKKNGGDQKRKSRKIGYLSYEKGATFRSSRRRTRAKPHVNGTKREGKKKDTARLRK